MAFGSSPTGRGNDFIITSHADATAVDRFVGILPRKCKLLEVAQVHSVVGGTSAAVRPRKITADAKAPGATAGTGVTELTTAAIDLTATANTVQNPALSATAGDLIFQAGDRLAEDYSGTLTGLAGCVIAYRFLAL